MRLCPDLAFACLTAHLPVRCEKIGVTKRDSRGDRWLSLCVPLIRFLTWLGPPDDLGDQNLVFASRTTRIVPPVDLRQVGRP